MHVIAIYQETNIIYTPRFKILKGYVFPDFLLTLTSNVFFDFSFFQLSEKLFQTSPIILPLNVSPCFTSSQKMQWHDKN